MPHGGRLRPASFRGVPFYVRSDSKSFPRSLQVDEFPRSDRWRIRDMGLRPDVHKVECYVADEDKVEAFAAALEAALKVDAPGWLILPAQAPFMAWHHTAERSFERTKLGILALRVEFIAEPPAFAAGISLGLTESLVENAIGAVASLATLAGATLAQTALASGAGIVAANVYQSAGFAAETSLRLAAISSEALASVTATEVVEAVRMASGFAGMAGIVDALSVAGPAGADALERLSA